MNDKISPGRLIGYLGEKKSLGVITAAMVIGVFLMLLGQNGSPLLSATEETAIEARVKALCEQAADTSEVAVMVNLDKEGFVDGVAIVCSGGDDPVIQLKLSKMICALFGIGSDSVSIIGSDG